MQTACLFKVRNEPRRELSRFFSAWWAYFDDRQNRLRTVAGKVVNLWWTVGSTTEVATLSELQVGQVIVTVLVAVYLAIGLRPRESQYLVVQSI